MISAALLTKPVQLVPHTLQQRLLEHVLNRVFKQQLIDEELDFLETQAIRIHVTDSPFDWCFCVQQQQLIVTHTTNPSQYQAEIRGNLAAFAQLASQTCDPDTLFFQRKLVIEGDTELGLAMKNFMDSVDFNELPLGMGKAITQGAKILQKLVK